MARCIGLIVGQQFSMAENNTKLIGFLTEGLPAQ
jgi:hypothetical protein